MTFARIFTIAVFLSLSLVTGFPSNIIAMGSVPPEESTTNQSATAQIPTGEIVDIELAKIVAADYLPKYYPGNWIYFDHLLAYDLDGLPAAYIIIFRDSNSKTATSEELNSTKENISDIKNQLPSKAVRRDKSNDSLSQDVKSSLKKYNELPSVQKRGIYKADIFATVITGATDISPLLIRCFKGLPDFVAKRSFIEDELYHLYPDKTFQLGQILFIGPLDIRYELKKSDKTKISAIQEGAIKLQIIEENDTVSLVNNKLELISIASEKRKTINKQVEINQLSKTMTPADMQRLKEGEIKRKQHYKDRWNQFKKN